MGKKGSQEPEHLSGAGTGPHVVLVRGLGWSPEADRLPEVRYGIAAEEGAVWSELDRLTEGLPPWLEGLEVVEPLVRQHPLERLLKGLPAPPRPHPHGVLRLDPLPLRPHVAQDVDMCGL